MSDKQVLDEICTSCEEGLPKNECPNSKRPCGHHCNHSWNQDECCWCGQKFGCEEQEAADGDDKQMADLISENARLKKDLEESMELMGRVVYSCNDCAHTECLLAPCSFIISIQLPEEIPTFCPISGEECDFIAEQK